MRHALARPSVGLLLLAAGLAAPSSAWGQAPDSSVLDYRYENREGTAEPPFVSTPMPAVDSMLALADVGAGDVVYDLGSGDGRIPIRAAVRHGARGVGIEIRPDLVTAARRRARDAGVADRVTFREGDFFEADLREATVVTLYLLPSANLKLRSKLLRELRPGTRVVSHDFHMEEWVPEQTVEFGDTLLYLWRVPEETPDFVEEPE
jgi:SAM-dependent methyltransferase